MALETLKGFRELDGFKVAVMDELREQHPEMFDPVSGQMDYVKFEKDFRPKYPVQIRHDKNSISFTIQNGPVGEAGVNGCQVTTLIAAALEIIKGLNAKFPCRENLETLDYLQKAITSQEERKKERTNRHVEGSSKL
jgi:hypothetical protein